jgi:hypothetical protein
MNVSNPFNIFEYAEEGKEDVLASYRAKTTVREVRYTLQAHNLMAHQKSK